MPERTVTLTGAPLSDPQNRDASALAVLVESEPKLRILVFYAFSSREPATASLENVMDSCLDAVSSREPVFTSLESAIGALR